MKNRKKLKPIKKQKTEIKNNEINDLLLIMIMIEKLVKIINILMTATKK